MTLDKIKKLKLLISGLEGLNKTGITGGEKTISEVRIKMNEQLRLEGEIEKNLKELITVEIKIKL